MMEPCWILIVGAAAAGKTTVANQIASRLPEFRVISDLIALVQLFEYNDRLKVSKSGLECEPSHLWLDLVDSSSGARVVAPMTRCLPDGGHEILDPWVWDEALRRVAESCRDDPYVILEFSRGEDPSYFALHGITGGDAYLPSFRVLAKELSSSIVKKIFVIHVHAEYAVRMSRNADRRSRGEHFVADLVMKEIYSEDCFRYSALAPLRHDGCDVTLHDLDTSRETLLTMTPYILALCAKVVGAPTAFL